MDIYEHISNMKPFIISRKWDELEACFRALAVEMAGKEQADAIAALDFPTYQDQLQSAVAEAIRQAHECRAKAVYFEYDLDNLWQSAFFLCGAYHSESVEDDDWACDWIKDFDGPDFPEASELYCENEDLDRTPIAKGSTLYLVARTVAAFGRCVERESVTDLAVCMAFHDQDPIMRIVEPG